MLRFHLIEPRHIVFLSFFLFSSFFTLKTQTKPLVLTCFSFSRWPSRVALPIFLLPQTEDRNSPWVCVCVWIVCLGWWLGWFLFCFGRRHCAHEKKTIQSHAFNSITARDAILFTLSKWMSEWPTWRGAYASSFACWKHFARYHHSAQRTRVSRFGAREKRTVRQLNSSTLFLHTRFTFRASHRYFWFRIAVDWFGADHCCSAQCIHGHSGNYKALVGVCVCVINV